jgi:hypothetical protein
MKGRYRLTTPSFIIGCDRDECECHKSRRSQSNSTEEPKLIRQCVLEISGKMFRWQAVGRLGARVGWLDMWWVCSTLLEVGSGRKQRDAAWHFQGAIVDCTHAVQLVLNEMVDYNKKSIMNLSIRLPALCCVLSGDTEGGPLGLRSGVKCVLFFGVSVSFTFYSLLVAVLVSTWGKSWWTWNLKRLWRRFVMTLPGPLSSRRDKLTF